MYKEIAEYITNNKNKVVAFYSDMTKESVITEIKKYLILSEMEHNWVSKIVMKNGCRVIVGMFRCPECSTKGFNIHRLYLVGEIPKQIKEQIYATIVPPIMAGKGDIIDLTNN